MKYKRKLKNFIATVYFMLLCYLSAFRLDLEVWVIEAKRKIRRYFGLQATSLGITGGRVKLLREAWHLSWNYLPWCTRCMFHHYQREVTGHINLRTQSFLHILDIVYRLSKMSSFLWLKIIHVVIEWWVSQWKIEIRAKRLQCPGIS